MPSDSRVLSVGPVRLTMPDGCVAELFFTFTGQDEKLMVTSYLETGDVDTKELAARRLESSRELVGDGLEVFRRQPGKVGDRVSYVTILKCTESDGQTSMFCQMLIELGRKRFLDLKYEFGQHSRGSLEEFDRIIGTLRLKDDRAPREASAAAPAGWADLDLSAVVLRLPPRLTRVTPYSFADTAKNIEWSADGWPLSWAPGHPTNTIPPDVSSPMSVVKRTETVSANQVVGTLTTISTTDPETGEIGDRIVRGEVVVCERARVIVRGRGPDSTAEKLEADLKRVLQNLILAE